MKHRTLARLPAIAALALPVAAAALLAWCGLTAALAGLDGTLPRSLALAGVGGCAFGLGCCAIWITAAVHALRSQDRPPLKRPL